MKRLLQRPYVYWLVGIFVFYLGLNVYISQFYETIQYLEIYAAEIHWTKFILGILFTLIISGLVAVNSVYEWIRYKERQQIKKSGVVACVGGVVGLATGVCSACVVSIFPLLFGLFGVSVSFASLPFQGMEVQLLVIVMLGLSLWWMGKK